MEQSKSIAREDRDHHILLHILEDKGKGPRERGAIPNRPLRCLPRSDEKDRMAAPAWRQLTRVLPSDAIASLVIFL
jgi:hypothetical protein